RGDYGVDPHTVGFGEIDNPPRRRVIQQSILGIPFERNRYAFGPIATTRELLSETLDEQFGAAMAYERHARLTDENRAGSHDRKSGTLYLVWFNTELTESTD